MQKKISKLQKIILIYVGVQANKQDSSLIKRRSITPKLFDILNKKKMKTFSVLLANSIRSLHKRNLICKRGRYIGLTKEGIENAREAKEEIINIYGEINWHIVGDYYGKKEKGN